MTSISDTEVVNAPGGLVELGENSTNRTNVAVTGTSTSNATELVATTIVCDGSPILVEFQCGMSITSGEYLSFGVWIDGVYTTTFEGSLAVAGRSPISAWARLTPTSGTKAISIRWWKWSGSTSTSYIEGMCRVRVSKVIQASQLLVTQSNAPIVTSLPAGNLVTGQEVDLYVTSPYAGYQRYKWNGSAWYIIGDSRAGGNWQTWNPTVTQPGNITYGSSYARYIINGKTVQVMFYLNITGTGTVGNAIIIGNLPINISNVAGAYGNFRIFDAGVTNTVGTLVGASQSSLSLYRDGDGNAVGIGSTSLTNGDIFSGWATYECV